MIWTICKQDHEGTKGGSFSRVCSRRNDLRRTASAKPDSNAADREEQELSRIKRAISTSKPCKLSGTDGTVFALLQQGDSLLMTHLCHYTKLGGSQGDIEP